MKSYRELVNKHFKAEKKRTFLTILGIISSIILFFNIGYIKNYINDTEELVSKERFGDYDVTISDIDLKTVNKIINNIKVEQCGFYRLESESNVQIGDIKKSIEIYKLDKASIEDIYSNRIEVTEGKLPSNSKEIVLTEQAKKQLNLKIGENLPVGNKNYTIVGFLKDDSEYIDYNFYGFTNFDTNENDDNVNMAFRVKNKNNKLEVIKSVISDCGLNYDLLVDESKIEVAQIILDEEYEYDFGSIYLDESIIAIGIVYLFILLITIVLTYGSINISLNERKKQLATLRCIGATPAKIKTLLIKESVMLGLYSLIPGIIIAQIVAWIISYILVNKSMIINYYSILNFKIYFDVILTTVILTSINIFCATIIPIIKVGKLYPIEVLKNKIKENKNIQKRNSKIIRKLFGYSGELAYKNIRANNKSFIITIVTLSLILLAIVGFSGFQKINDMYLDTSTKRLNDINIVHRLNEYDIQGNQPSENVIKRSDDFILGVKNLAIHKKMYTNINLKVKGILEGVQLNKYFIDDTNFVSFKFNEKDSIKSGEFNLLVLDKEHINKILPYIQSDNNEITKVKANDFIVVDKIKEGQLLNYRSENPILAKPGDNINLYLSKNNGFEDIDTLEPISMNYLGTIDSKEIVGNSRLGYYDYFNIIVSEEFYLQNKDLLIKNSDSCVINISMDLDNSKDKNITLSNLREYLIKHNADFIEEKSNEIELKEETEVAYLIVYIALFLTVFISSINIANTRSLDIYLREKEFKVLLAIGMKKSKLKKMIFLEGIVSWFISTCIGGILSLLTLIIISGIYYYQGYIDKIYIPFEILIIGIVILFIIAIISSSIPYKRLKNIDINDLMKEDD